MPQEDFIDVVQEREAVVISVRGHLDLGVGQSLVRAAAAAVDLRGVNRLDVDLRALESFTMEGTDALVACRSLGARLPDGLHYRTGRGAGRTALLTAYKAVDTAEMRAIDVPSGEGPSMTH